MGNVVRVEFAPALMTRELAAFYISGSLTDVDRLRNKGELTSYGDGKRVLLKKDELDAYIAGLPERQQVGGVA